MRPEKHACDPGLALKSDAETLRQAAQGLGLEPTAKQLEQLVAFRDALLKWNKVYNLTAIRDPQGMLQQHLIDCLAVVPAFRRQSEAQRKAQLASGGQADTAVSRILDVGSGGGLPGVVLAVLMPDLRVDCVDAVAKKAAFVRQVAAELGLLNLLALHSRVEDLRPPGPLGRGYGLITSRAFASLADFTNWTEHLIDRDGVWAAMKGQVPQQELREPGLRAQVFHVELLHPPALAAERCLVWLRPPSSSARAPAAEPSG